MMRNNLIFGGAIIDLTTKEQTTIITLTRSNYRKGEDMDMLKQYFFDLWD